MSPACIPTHNLYKSSLSFDKLPITFCGRNINLSNIYRGKRSNITCEAFKIYVTERFVKTFIIVKLECERAEIFAQLSVCVMWCYLFALLHVFAHYTLISVHSSLYSQLRSYLDICKNATFIAQSRDHILTALYYRYHIYGLNIAVVGAKNITAIILRVRKIPPLLNPPSLTLPYFPQSLILGAFYISLNLHESHENIENATDWNIISESRWRIKGIRITRVLIVMSKFISDFYWHFVLRS